MYYIHGDEEIVLCRVILFGYVSPVCLQFASYAESQTPELARSVYSRACSIHLQRKPNIHVAWAVFEEKQGEFMWSVLSLPVL